VEHANAWARIWDGTAAGAPGARGRHAMAWDDARRRAVLFGGASGTGELGDVWEWTGHRIRAVAPASHRSSLATPAKRRRDDVPREAGPGGAVRRVLGGTYLNDHWEWDADQTPPDASGQRHQKRRPMAQLTVSYAEAGFRESSVTAVRVRARAGGAFGTGTGAQLLGWRSGGPSVGPGEWVPLASNVEGVPIPAAPAVSCPGLHPESIFRAIF